MALTYSWPGVDALATTTDARKALAGMIAKDTSGVARHGIFPAHANPLVTARSDMNVDIATFTAAAVQFGGPILLTNDGVAQLPSVLVSPGAGTNYYVIYAKQNESTSPGTDANNNRVFGAQLSTTSFAAARAALPAGAEELATVEMPTGKTATNQSLVVITPTFQYTAAANAPVWVRNATELAAWAPADGFFAYKMDDKRLYQRAAGAWSAVDTPGLVTATRSTNTNVTTTPTAIPFQSATSSGAQAPTWAVGNATRLVATVAGVYALSILPGQINSTGTATIFVRINGLTAIPLTSATVTNASGACVFSGYAAHVELAASDYVEVVASISTGTEPWIATNKVSLTLLAGR